MIRGSGNTGRNAKAELFGGIPVIGANNGLTVVGGLVQLGGANPLIQNTVINQAGFQYQHLNGVQDIFNLDPTAGLYSLGDILGMANGTHLVLNDATQVAGIFTSLFGGPAALLLSNGLTTSQMGDIGNAGNSTLLQITDNIQAVEFISGVGNKLKWDASSLLFDLTFSANRYLNIDKSNNMYQFGDINGSNSGSTLQLDDATGISWIVISTGVRLLLDTLNGNYAIGDVGLFGNGTHVLIDDTNKTYNLNTAGALLHTIIGTAGSEAAAWLGTTPNSQINFAFNGTFTGISIFDDTNNPFILLSAPSTAANDVYIENVAGELRLTEDTKAAGIALFQTGHTVFGAIGTPDNGVSSIQSSNSISTADPGGGMGNWKLGIPIVAASVLDATRYVEVDINGAVIKLAVIV